ncbi:MAG: hypothetical protein AAGH82_05030 [Pseudomonadota bacterium]
MPDYHAVLKKTLAGLPTNTPEIRTKVYDKARATIRRQLEAMQPALPLERIEAEVANLETAIVDVEAEQAPPELVLPAEDDILGDLEAELGLPSGPSAPSVDVPSPPQTPEPPQASAPAASAAAPATLGSFSGSSNSQSSTVPGPAAPTAPAPPPPAAAPMAPAAEPATKPSAAFAKQPKKRSRKGLFAFLFVLLVLLGGAFAASQAPGGLNGIAQQLVPGLEIPFLGIAPDGDASAGDQETVPAATTTEVTADPAPEEDETKFGERLGADGSTTEAEPIVEPTPDPTLVPADPADPTIEGPSEGLPSPDFDTDGGLDEPQPGDVVVDENGVQFTVPAEPGDGDQAAVAPPAEDAAPAGATVAQRAFFYVENGGTEGTTRVPGSVIWSNGDRDGLPTVEADISVDELGIGVKMVLRKNLDETLSASHVIDILFDLPDGFSGNGIESVRQVVFKPTEEQQGNALIAEPAKISDTFFIVALYDLPEAEAANIQIMRERPWIDLPVAYTTGRRALLTLEKGARGTDVFRTAFDVWAQSDG